MKIDRATIEKAFIFLDDLRDSAICNMWGATPYLAQYLGADCSRDGADILHTLWIKSFDATGQLEMEPRVEWAASVLSASQSV